MGRDEIQLSSGVTLNLPCKRLATSDSNDHPRSLMEKVNNVWGSTAGAGSDFFHTYRKHRSTEMQRLNKMDQEYEEQQEAEEFQKRRNELAKLNGERAAKAASKREKIKERRQKVKDLKKRGAEINNFSNDGSFLSQLINYQKFTTPLIQQPSSTHIISPLGPTNDEKHSETVESSLPVASSASSGSMADSFREAAIASETGLTAEQASVSEEQNLNASDDNSNKQKEKTNRADIPIIRIIEEDMY